MNDTEFLAAFESGTLPNTDFRHGGHLRMAWLYLRRDGLEQGSSAAIAALRRFAAAKGAFSLYNETLTRFWIAAVAHHLPLAPAGASFEEFVAAFPRLTDKSLVTRHFRPETLAAPAARTGWVEADLDPLPEGMAGPA